MKHYEGLISFSGYGYTKGNSITGSKIETRESDGTLWLFDDMEANDGFHKTRNEWVQIDRKSLITHD